MTPQQALEILKRQRSIMPDNHQTAQALNIAIEVMEKTKHTIPIERIEEIIISTAPAPAKLNQITNLIEKYKK